MIFLDIETRADLNVVEVGLYRHAPTADILGMQYRIGDAPMVEWRGNFADGVDPDLSDAPPRDLIEAVESGMPIVAWNAAYERVVMREQPWWPVVPIEQYICAAAWAACFNLPRALGQCSKMLLPADAAKLTDVSAGIKYMWDKRMPLKDPDHMDAQMLYCGRDVDAMCDILDLLPPFDPQFIEQYQASEYVNDRGVLIDRDLADAIVEMKPIIEGELLQELHEVAPVKLRGPSLLKWLQQELPEDMQDILMANKKVREGYGFKTRKKLSSDKSVRRALRAALEDVVGYSHVIRALDCYDEANKAAVTKFQAAINRVSDDGALRGQFVFAGAGQTRRYSSHGVQVHNLKRDVADNALDVIDALKANTHQPRVLPTLIDMTANDAASGVLRPLFVAGEGGTLIWGDWSSIEARCLPWLTNDSRAEKVLDIFREGGDVYKVEASGIYGKPVDEIDKEERQVGKVAILALGYQGGVGAFQAMAAGYGVQMPDARADEIKRAWRANNPAIVDFWRKLEDGAMAAIDNPGFLVQIGRVWYQYCEDLLRGTLICWLPCGGWVAYPEARIRFIPAAWDEDEEVAAICFMHPTYGPSSTYGGAMCENITQATAGSLLRRAVVMCEKAGLETVLHVHDEIVCETDLNAEWAVERLQEIMRDVPDWAEGLPLDADVEIGLRYKVS